MSVLVTVKIPGDTDAFRRYVEEHGEAMAAITEEGRSRGAIHHRFAIGEGFILVLDEWDNPDSFRAFFEGNERIGEVMAASGAQGEPEITVAEAIDTVDMF